MVRGNGSPSPEAKDTLRALRRAAKRALELGLQTGTPVYVWKDGKSSISHQRATSLEKIEDEALLESTMIAASRSG
jgi:hypothetical protein